MFLSFREKAHNNSSVVKIQDLAVNNESRPVKSNSEHQETFTFCALFFGTTS